MATTTAAGSAIAISSGLPTTQDAAGFGALTWVEIGQVEKIGTIGAVFAKVEFQPLKGPKQKHKGSVDYGSLQPSLAHDEADAGQALLRVAADDGSSRLYAFRVTYPTGAIRYFLGRVFGYPETVDGADTVLMANPTVEIDTKPVKVGGTTGPAPVFTAQPSISPASGTAGATTFTANDGAASNALAYTRRWLLTTTAGVTSAIGTDPTITPSQAGSLALEVTATGTGGSATVTSPTATVAAAPTVTISAAQSKAEGASGATVYTYTVTRSATAGAVNVPWAFQPGTTSPDDFTGGSYPAGGTVALASGQASGTITISVNGDAVVEGDETFTVLISTPSGYVAGAATSATGTVLNDDVLGPTLPSYIGQVGTRSFLNNAVVAAATDVAMMSRTKHVAREDMDVVAVRMANGWFDAATQGQWTPSGGTMAAKITLERANGTIVGPFLWGGSDTSSIASGEIGTSDFLSGVGIKKGEVYYERKYIVMGGVGVMTTTCGGAGQHVPEDQVYFGTSATDLTGVSGALPAGTGPKTSTTNAPYSAGMIGATTKPSFFLLGDSITIGTADTATDDSGILARSIGPTHAYVNAGVSGNQASWIVRNASIFRALAKYTTHVILAAGTNDAFNDTKTAAQLAADMAHMRAMFPNHSVVEATMLPRTTGTADSPANQTIRAGESVRLADNARRRGTPNYIELADVLESGRDSGFWKANNPVYTTDMTHPTVTGYTAVAAAGVVNPATIGALSTATKLWTPDDLDAGASPPSATGIRFGLWLRADEPGISGASWPPTNNTATILQATAANQPVLTPNVLNGLPGMLFDGVNDYMIGSPTFRGIAQSRNSLTYAAVIQPNTMSAAGQIIFCSVNANVTTNRCSLYRQPTGEIVLVVKRNDADALVNVITTATIPDNSPALVVATVDFVAGAVTVWINGVQAATGAPATSGGPSDATLPAAFAIGGRGDGTFPFKGYIFSAIALRWAVQTADRQKLEGFWADKYGLRALLPTGHPYKSAAPNV